MKNVRNLLFALVAVSLLLSPVVFASDAKPAPKAEEKAKAYPLDTCIVSGEKLGKDQATVVDGGQEFKFCCKDCIKKFQADTKKYHEKLAKAAGEKHKG